MIALSIAANVKGVEKRVKNIAEKQIPFAAAQAVTALAKRVQAAETKALPHVFDRPTPFTQRAFGVKAATKASPTATIFTRPIQASYLHPYESGGRQVPLHGLGILKPVKAALNAYGNLPRNAMQRYKGRADIFIGTLNTRSGGMVTGVWQDLNVDARSGRQRKRKNGKASKRLPLKLLVRIGDPVAVHQHLDFHKRGRAIVSTFAKQEFRQALRKALATAR